MSTNRRRRIGVVLTACLLAAGCGHQSAQQPSGSAATGTTSATRAVTSPVAQPTPGSVHSTVKATTPSLLAPIPLGTSGRIEGVTVTVTASRAAITATQPGDTNGPGIRVDVVVKNPTSADVSTQLTTVTAEGQGVPGAPLYGPPTQRLASHVASGAEAQGHYFIRFTTIPHDVRVLVSLQPDRPTLVYSGAPR